MKKVLAICLVMLSIVLMTGIVFNICNYLKVMKVKNFNLNEEPYYLQAIVDFPSEKYLGETLTAEEVRKKAEIEWVAMFGDYVKDRKPYEVFFDAENDVWLVKGTISPILKGRLSARIPYMIIRKSDGKILAIWGH